MNVCDNHNNDNIIVILGAKWTVFHGNHNRRGFIYYKVAFVVDHLVSWKNAGKCLDVPSWLLRAEFVFVDRLVFRDETKALKLNTSLFDYSEIPSVALQRVLVRKIL